MKKLTLIAVAMGLALVLCGSESWGKGGSRGSSGGAGRGSKASRGSKLSRDTPVRRSESRGSNSRTRISTGRYRTTEDVRRTTRVVADDAASATEDGDASSGMEIRELSKGTARKQGMKVGDIIMAVNGTATPDFDSLQSALAASGSKAEVDFINVDNGKLERITLSPKDGTIGVAVVPVSVD